MKKALKIAFFIAVFSVLFSFTAFADSISLTLDPGETAVINISDAVWFDNPQADTYLYAQYSVTSQFTVISAAPTAAGSNTGASDSRAVASSRTGGFFYTNIYMNYSGRVYSYVNVEVTVQNTDAARRTGSTAVNAANAQRGNGTIGGNTINSNVLQILSKLEDIQNSSTPPDFLGPDAILYFSSQYFNRIWTTANEYPGDDGYFRIANTCKTVIFYNQDTIDYALPPGSYYVILSFYADSKPTTVYFAGQQLDDFVVQQDWADSTLYRLYAVFHVNDSNFGRELAFNIDSNFIQGLIYGGIAKYSDDSIAGDALNPDQEANRSELENQGEQQAQQEEQLWQNVNTYKGQMDFTLSSWNEVESGLSYVSSIFMMIWSNSPTQIITLSLMLGIGMLAIGRGVRAAVYRRSGGDDG